MLKNNILLGKQNPKEENVVKNIIKELQFFDQYTDQVNQQAEHIIQKIRNNKSFSIEKFMSTFNLDTEEGFAILSVAEALLRIPDYMSSKELILDKMSKKNWKNFLDHNHQSYKMKFLSYGLYLGGKFANLSLSEDLISKTVLNLGSKVFVESVRYAIDHFGKEFVFAKNIEQAISKARKLNSYSFSFDILGESSRTKQEADTYYNRYNYLIDYIQKNNLKQELNVSVKLSALHPRVELSKISILEKELLPKLISLIEKSKKANITITFDAEELFRLDIYLIILTKLMEHEISKDFHGIGFVVQAYHTKSLEIIDYIIELSKTTTKKIPIRLVKGAYWDTEIKRSQEIGEEVYPVFTKKEYTDANYLVCAKKMLQHNENIYSQFGTHNVFTALNILEIGGDKQFEFQKLYGMGDILHNELAQKKPIRIYAPIGESNDLLAYLMRRMLENGANNNFVYQVNKNNSNNFAKYNIYKEIIDSIKLQSKIKLPSIIYNDRINPAGYELGYKYNYDFIHGKVLNFFHKQHKSTSVVNGKNMMNENMEYNYYTPLNKNILYSKQVAASDQIIESALSSAKEAFNSWVRTSVEYRANILHKIANSYEENKYQLYAMLIEEAGKTIKDAINEVIEAIDFCRYYANLSLKLLAEIELPSPTGEQNTMNFYGKGVFLCISPWNFPLAILTGQIVAALVTGNTVIAKPANQTCVIGNFAIRLMHEAGIPENVLHMLIINPQQTSNLLVADNRVNGIAFTGSTNTARNINLKLAERDNQSGIIPLIAETGGQNAMIVDSSALLEQTLDNILESAFYSAGQRCSALRILYIQDVIYEKLLNMIKDALLLIKIGDTRDFSNDIGPIIDDAAIKRLSNHIQYMKNKNFNIYSSNNKQENNLFFNPTIIEINSIFDIPDEVFGPILHIVKYDMKKLDKVIDDVNNYGFGLTFGIQSRINSRINYIISRANIGNIYVNRSIIGAKVESQPFGGENRSGTGFKAGGPNYLLKFITERTKSINLSAIGCNVDLLKF